MKVQSLDKRMVQPDKPIHGQTINAGNSDEGASHAALFVLKPKSDAWFS